MRENKEPKQYAEKKARKPRRLNRKERRALFSQMRKRKPSGGGLSPRQEPVGEEE